MLFEAKRKFDFDDELKTFLPFYLQKFVFALSKIIMPFWILYFLNIGFTYTQIGIICSIRSIVSLIFEIPTGVFADTKGKKVSVISGYFLAGLTYLMIPLYNNYYYILVVFIINSFVETLISGSDQAWATELANNDTRKIGSYFLKMASVQNFAVVFSPIIGGLVAQRFGFKWLWIVFGIGTIISSGILLFAKKDSVGYAEEHGFKLIPKIKLGFDYIRLAPQ
ncbi:MAG: MFS transporter [bacterium]